jgi:hypothetical protein
LITVIVWNGVYAVLGVETREYFATWVWVLWGRRFSAAQQTAKNDDPVPFGRKSEMPLVFLLGEEHKRHNPNDPLRFC